MKRLFTLAILACLIVPVVSANNHLFALQEIVDKPDQESNGIIMMQADNGQESGMQIMSFEPGNLSSPFNSPFSSGMFGDSFGLLNNRNVQKDLELIDDQLDRIKEINKEFGKKIAEKVKMMRGENGSIQIDGASSISKLIQDLKAQQKAEIEGLLLPQQQKRLKQVKLQMQMQNRGTARTLDKLAKELNITGDQKKRILKRQKELKKEFQEQLAQLKEDSRKALLNELTADQRKKFKDMVGERYEFDEKQNSSPFRMPGSQKYDF